MKSHKGVTMVISAAGMAICLLWGCGAAGGVLTPAGTAARESGFKIQEEWREQEAARQAEEEAAEEAAGERLAYYQSCDSGTVVEGALTEEETEALFSISEISEELFARMNGVTYVENDDISRSELRYLRLLYVGFDEEVHVGEMVVNEQIAGEVRDIFRELYENGYQIEKMRLMDDYGGDDDLAVQDNNTSCFNYRVVEGSTSLSRHAYGLAIDINPFYNPYVTYPGGVERISPAGSEAYADRSADFPHKIGGEGDLCLSLFSERGFTWGGNWRTLKDYQHFQK